MFGRLTEYNASLLKKCTKLYKRTALVADNARIAEIEEKFEDVDIPEFDQIFSRDFENEDAYPGISEPFDSFLKKLAILNHLCSRHIELTIKHGQGPALFEQLWHGRFKGEASSIER